MLLGAICFFFQPFPPQSKSQWAQNIGFDDLKRSKLINYQITLVQFSKLSHVSKFNYKIDESTKWVHDTIVQVLQDSLQKFRYQKLQFAIVQVQYEEFTIFLYHMKILPKITCAKCLQTRNDVLYD